MSAPQAPARRANPLAMDPETFRTLGHALVDQVAARLAAIPGGPVTPPDATPSGIRAALGLDGSLPEQGSAPGPLLAQTADGLFGHSLFNGHPRFLGYITSSPAPIGMLADLLAAAVNPNVGGWMLSPGATEIEVQAVRWIAQLIGFPTESAGVMVSGGNMANMVGFWAARAAKAGFDLRAKGVAEGPRLRAYASAETHTWIQKAADLSGLGTDSVRGIPTHDGLRMDLAALKTAIAADRAAGDRPFLVVGTAGSVSTGAVDDLPAIAALCREHGLWFHVDGAYGGFAASLPDASPALRGLALADSVAVDPHKWLYAPLEAGCALVRDKQALLGAFSYHPPYYLLDEEAVNFVDYSPQNSRGFRALKVWLALRMAGAAGYRRMIADDIALAEHMAARVRATPGLEFTSRELGITTWRVVPADLAARVAEPAVATHLDALNTRVVERMQAEGEAFVSHAILKGRFVLRACFVNMHTQASDADAIVALSARLGGEVDRELRPAGL